MHLPLFLWLGVASWYLDSVVGHHTYNEDATVSRFKDGFTQSRLVPDLITSFNPQGSIILRYSEALALRHPGTLMSSKDVQARPAVQLFPERFGELSSTDTFTLIMVDPDSPIHANPSGSKLHWLSTGLKLNRLHDPVETYFLENPSPYGLDYLPPFPEANTGVHRYTFLLYKASLPQDALQPFQNSTFNRTGFNLIQFTSSTGLKDPYAGAYMNIDSSKSPNPIKMNAQTNSASGFKLGVPTYLLTLFVVLYFR